MVVLEGAQGIYKSTLLEVLGGRWYAIMRDAPESKDFGIVLQGKWLIEVAEMDAFSRADVKATKRTLSTATDRYRSPFAVHAEDHARRSIFAGSTNRDDWNTDDTGARRFYPVACKEVRLDLARINRDQYFAEAVQLLQRGATWWETPPEETSREQWARFESDPWAEPCKEALIGHGTCTLSWLMKEIGVPIERQDKAQQRRISGILRVMGWERKQVWNGSRPAWTWVRP
jgi:predicted P-loop ATPase